jgi:LacI family sucrose operon transcriptional repressor
MSSIKDVASKVGVSISTVSRVINNTGYIGKETRRKVEEAIKELKYEPNLVARSLQRSQSYLVGVIVPDSSHPFFSELIKYIEAYLAQFDYKILICNSLDNPGKEQQYISMLRQNRVDGIIMCGHTLETNEYKKLKFPIVTFDRIISNEIPYVGSDNFLGGQLAAHHLIQKGCKRLLFLSGPLNIDLLTNRRWDGFRSICWDQKIQCEIFESNYDILDFDGLFNALKESIFKNIDQYDGIFCNDTAAYALYIALKEVGIQVPDQIKIVGYDNHSFTRMLQTPQITTIMQPIDRIGKALSATIIQLIGAKDGKSIDNTIVNVELIIGKTT